jgi:hypothetical protein
LSCFASCHPSRSGGSAFVFPPPRHLTQEPTPTNNPRHLDRRRGARRRFCRRSGETPVFRLSLCPSPPAMLNTPTKSADGALHTSVGLQRVRFVKGTASAVPQVTHLQCGFSGRGTPFRHEATFSAPSSAPRKIQQTQRDLAPGRSRFMPHPRKARPILAPK